MAEVYLIVQQLEDALQDARRESTDARRVLRIAEEQESGLAKALRALKPDHPLVQKEAPAAKHVRPAKRKQVSNALIDRAREVVFQSEEPVTVSYVAARLDVSTSAANAALQTLRSREEIRLAGKERSPGAPSLFAAMNGGDA